VAEEGEGQSGLNPAEPLVDDLLGLADGVEAEVGQLAAFQVPQICSTGLRSGA
jgi:hypothetical protein